MAAKSLAEPLSHLKFPNFRMWIERIIKQWFSHNFNKFLNIYFVYRKSSIGKRHCLIFWIEQIGSLWVLHSCRCILVFHACKRLLKHA
jgi:hypothetical protein